MLVQHHMTLQEALFTAHYSSSATSPASLSWPPGNIPVLFTAFILVSAYAKGACSRRPRLPNPSLPSTSWIHANLPRCWTYRTNCGLIVYISISVKTHLLDGGDEEGQSLASPRLGLADHVAAALHGRDGCSLHICAVGVAQHIVQRAAVEALRRWCEGCEAGVNTTVMSGAPCACPLQFLSPAPRPRIMWRRLMTTCCRHSADVGKMAVAPLAAAGGKSCGQELSFQ